MSDIQRKDNDFYIIDGDLRVIDNTQSVVQYVIEKLQSFAFEWFIDDDGLPYFEHILQKKVNINYVENLISNAIINTDGVSTLDKLELFYNDETRGTELNFTMSTIFGETVSLNLPHLGSIPIPETPENAILDFRSDAIKDFRDDNILDLS